MEKVEVEPSLVSVAPVVTTFSSELNGKSFSNGAVCSPQVSVPPRWQISEEKIQLYQRAKIAVLCIVVVIVLILLSLPIIFYHLPDQDEPGPTVTCDSYTGNVCRNVLQSQQSCLPDGLGSSEIHISPRDGDNQEELEIQAQLLLNGLSSPLISASPECEEAVLPFLCLYLFSLCDSNGTLYQPSSMDCVTISTVVCAREWIIATMLLGQERLPQCDSLPAETLECETVTTGSNITMDSGNITRDSSNDTDVGSLECHDGFYANAMSCLPRCDTWEQHPHSTNVITDVFVLLSAAIGLIAGVAVLVIAYIRRKRMFVFPSVFVVYMTITLVVLAIFVLISYTDRSGLYCSSLDLQQSVENTSAFCTVAGTVFYYTLLQLALWWFFHVASLFWKIKFPFSARAAASTLSIKLVHFMMALLAIVLPIVPVVATLATSGFGITRFPPILCTGTNADATFYSLVLPIVVLMQVGIAMLIVVFWMIHKHQGLFRIKLSKGPFKIDTAERKILIVFCYYVILGVIALTTFTLNTKNSDRTTKEIVEYFGCESLGPEEPCDRSGFEAQLHPVLDCLSYMLLGLFPAVNLIFAVNVKELKQWYSRSRLFRLVSTTVEFPSTATASAPAVNSNGNESYALPPAQ